MKGAKLHFRDNSGFLFREEDQDLAKHPLIWAEIKGKDVSNYRNVKITGTALSTYFDVKNEKFVFNKVELKKDEEDSLIFTDEELKLFGFHTPRNSLGQPNSHSTPSEPKIAKVSGTAFDHVDILKAINLSSSLKMEKFDDLKDDAKVWIGRLECAIVSVGGVLYVHGLGVSTNFVVNPQSKQF